jgi:hypothetical protein
MKKIILSLAILSFLTVNGYAQTNELNTKPPTPEKSSAELREQQRQEAERKKQQERSQAKDEGRERASKAAASAYQLRTFGYMIKDKVELTFNDRCEFTDIAPENLYNNSDSIKLCDKPLLLDDLTDGYKVFYSAGKTVTDVNGNIIFVSVKNEKEITQLNYKFLQTRRDECPDSSGKVKILTWGVGIDLKLFITSKNKSIKLTSLSNIAAAVNYKDAEVEYKLDVIGITGDLIRTNVNLTGDFNVDNYVNIKSNIDNIIANMSKAGVKIKPQLISEE